MSDVEEIITSPSEIAAAQKPQVALAISEEPLPDGVVRLVIPREWNDPESYVEGRLYQLRKKDAQNWAVEHYGGPPAA